VCDESLDNIKGYVNSKQLLIRAINGREISVTDEKLVKNCPILPDTLNLFEAMEYFKNNRVDFAVVMNEYALVLGIVTVDDLQSAVTGTWVMDESEEQIVSRGENSWLIDGVTPVSDVMRALNIESFPHIQNYETIAGFMMFMLRKFPKRCDFVNYSGYKFEVVDIDDYKVDQLLVTKIIDISVNKPLLTTEKIEK
jgi:CBS domain containing-hemolysin-like protein